MGTQIIKRNAQSGRIVDAQCISNLPMITARGDGAQSRADGDPL